MSIRGVDRLYALEGCTPVDRLPVAAPVAMPKAVSGDDKLTIQDLKIGSGRVMSTSPTLRDLAGAIRTATRGRSASAFWGTLRAPDVPIWAADGSWEAAVMFAQSAASVALAIARDASQKPLPGVGPSSCTLRIRRYRVAKYEKPGKRIHRGFYYLDDETVINSLSAIEAGKVDEVVARVATAREGGLGGALGVHGAKIEGGKKSNSSVEEELVRTRTRFSVFEIWYQTLVEQKGLGTFEGWSADLLSEVEPGDTIEFRADVELVPLQVLFEMYYWFATQAKAPGTIFSQKGEQLNQIKAGERVMKMLAGGDDAAVVMVTGRPGGDQAPVVAMELQKHNVIGELGRLSGRFGVVGQVDRVLAAGDEMPALRLLRSAPPTKLELEALRDAVSKFDESATEFGLSKPSELASIKGPALWITPIAVFR